MAALPPLPTTIVLAWPILVLPIRSSAAFAPSSVDIFWPDASSISISEKSFRDARYQEIRPRSIGR